VRTGSAAVGTSQAAPAASSVGLQILDPFALEEDDDLEIDEGRSDPPPPKTSSAPSQNVAAPVEDTTATAVPHPLPVVATTGICATQDAGTSSANGGNISVL